MRTGNADDFTVEEFWKRLATAPVSFKPGERWEYSNTGYILLGIIIESLTKKPYGEFLNERIFKTLGMNDTKYLEPPSASKNRAVGYDWEENAFRPSPYFSGGYAAGGLVSTVTDLAKWDAALNTEKLLKQASLEQMWTPAKLGSGKPVSFDFRGAQTSYGFGWFLTSYRGHKVVTHGGTVSGFSSQVMRFPDDKITIIVNSNSKSGADRIGHAEYLVQSIADIHVPKMRMFQGLRTVIYHVDDLEGAKAWYAKALALEPYFDQPFYVGFNIGGFELGLDPDMSGVTKGNNAVAYWGVKNAASSYERLLKLGAKKHGEVQEVGGGIRVATVTDPFGNIFGIIENPNFKFEGDK